MRSLRGFLIPTVLVFSLPLVGPQSLQEDRRSRLYPISTIPVGELLQMTRVSALAATDSTFVVADEGSQEVTVLTIEGDVVLRVGGKGEGPGEFKRIHRLGLSANSVALYDGGTFRLTIFDVLADSLESEYPLSGLGVRSGARFMNGGSIRFLGDTALSLGVSVPVVDPTPDRMHGEEFWIVGREGSIRNTVPIPIERQIAWLYPKADGTTGTLFFPYSPWSVWGSGPDGRIATAWGGEYRIWEMSGLGDTVRIIHREVPPLPVSSAEREHVRRALDEVLELLKAARAAFRRPVRNTSQFITSLNYSQDGEGLWVGRSLNRTSPVFDFFKNGGFRCAVTLMADPNRAYSHFIPPVFSNKRAFLLTQNAVDDAVILVFDISNPCN